MHLALVAGSGLVTLLVYALFARARKPARPASTHPTELQQTVFDVFEREGARTALSSSPHFWTGAFYCLFFYLWAPLLVWRYGVLRSLAYLSAPIGGALALSVPIGLDGPWAAMLFYIPLRVVVALWIKSHGGLIRVDRMVTSGWTHVGSCRASTAVTAIEAFFPSPSKPRRWYEFRAPGTNRRPT